MARDRHEHAVTAHIDLVSARDGAETDRLAASMLGSCWPGGVGDRTELAALQWLRRWGPGSAGFAPPSCDCGHGHCRICN